MDEIPLHGSAPIEVAAFKHDKDQLAVTVTIETACCFRQHRFDAPVDGNPDPKADCHLGLKALDFNICGHCVWVGVRPPPATFKLTGTDAMRLMSFMQDMKDMNAKPDQQIEHNLELKEEAR